MIRKIRDLLYDQGFTISGARNRLHEIIQIETENRRNGEVMLDGMDLNLEAGVEHHLEFAESGSFDDGEFSSDGIDAHGGSVGALQQLQFVRQELFEIRELLTTTY